MRVLSSGRQVPHRCSQGRMRRYPEDLAAGPVRSWQEVQQRRQRINQSAVPRYAQNNIDADQTVRTYENEDPISILMPTLNQIFVLILCSLGVHGEERPRAVTELGFSLRSLI